MEMTGASHSLSSEMIGVAYAYYHLLPVLLRRH
jgi:hypothetical protein